MCAMARVVIIVVSSRWAREPLACKIVMIRNFLSTLALRQAFQGPWAYQRSRSMIGIEFLALLPRKISNARTIHGEGNSGLGDLEEKEALLKQSPESQRYLPLSYPFFPYLFNSETARSTCCSRVVLCLLYQFAQTPCPRARITFISPSRAQLGAAVVSSSCTVTKPLTPECEPQSSPAPAPSPHVPDHQLCTPKPRASPASVLLQTAARSSPLPTPGHLVVLGLYQDHNRSVWTRSRLLNLR
jgi:hypothetical protein